MVDPTVARHSSPSGVRSLFSGVGADNLVPAIGWGALTVAKLAYLAQLLVVGPRGANAVLYTTTVLQMASTTMFTSLFFAFFAIRKPVVGRRASVGDRLVAFTGTILPLIPVAHRPDGQSPLILLASACLVLLGTALASVALLSLGRHFGIAPEARGMVTAGLYRYVRHPIYLGEITATLGATIAMLSWPSVALFALLCCIQYRRTALEERTLRATFPEYADYQKRTYRIIPGLS